jgi:hypothetical protein
LEDQLLEESLLKYLQPPIEIEKAIVDASIYYQFLNQKDLKKFLDNPDSYSGTVQELGNWMGIQEFMEMELGKPWSTLEKALFLLDHFTATISIDWMGLLSNDDVAKAVEILKKGLRANDGLSIWLASLDKKKKQAIYDATKIKLTGDDDPYKQFQVLSAGSVNAKKGGFFKIYKWVLEVESPQDLIYYFNTAKEEMENCVIMAIQRSPKYNWKVAMIMFLIYEGRLYTISNSERRLNIFNTSGARNPARWFDRAYEKVWIPVEMVFDDKRKDSRELAFPNTKTYRILEINEMLKGMPEFPYWLGIFIIRVIDMIESGRTILPVASNSMLLLEDLNSRTEAKNPVAANDFTTSASAYLEKKYGSQVTSIVLAKENLPDLIGTQKFTQDVIAYMRRGIFAKKVENMLYEDWQNQKQGVIDWWKDFIKSQPIDLLLSAFNKKLSKAVYYKFSMSKREEDGAINVDGEYFKELANLKAGDYPVVLKTRISACFTNNYYYHGYMASNPNDVEWSPLYENHIGTQCANCKELPWKRIAKITFTDYRQILELFNLKEADLPRQFAEHLHDENATYTGNSILDDTDPMDDIHDPWFREHPEDESPNLTVLIPLCNRCARKLLPDKYRKDVEWEERRKKERKGER